MQKATFTRVIGSMTKPMDKDNICKIVALNILVVGKMIRRVAMERRLGKTVHFTLENTSMGCNMEKVRGHP